jgi:protein-tyrosine phosphatase
MGDRRLACDACLNLRDVGGYRTTDGATIRWRTLLRSDSLCQLTPEGAASLLGHGLRTIIDLRHPDEVAEAIHPFGPSGAHAHTVSYHNIPMRDPDDAEIEAAYLACQSLLDVYLLSLDRCADRFAMIARAILDAAEGATIVHCHAGKDRTGIVIAVLLALAGVPTETIVADYAVSFEYLRPLWDARVAAGLDTDLDIWFSKPETIQVFLDRLEQVHGGARQYLLTAGLTDDEIERLRLLLRDESGTTVTLGTS